MAKKPNKRLIGGFIVFGIALLIGSIFLFFWGSWFKSDFRPVLFFEGSIKGLSVGSNVMFRGVPVGKVEEVAIIPSHDRKVIIPVYISFDNKTIEKTMKGYNPREALGRMVESGLKGKLQNQNILTGQMMIELDFYPNSPTKFLAGEYNIDSMEIPTIPSTLEALSQNVEKLPLMEITDNLNKLLVQTNSAAASINNFVNAFVGPGSSTMYDITNMIKDLSKTAKSWAGLADYLERHPEALLKGKGGY